MSLGGQSAPLLFVVAFFRESQAAPSRSSPQDHRLLHSVAQATNFSLHDGKAPHTNWRIWVGQVSRAFDGSSFSLLGISWLELNNFAENYSRFKAHSD